MNDSSMKIDVMQKIIKRKDVWYFTIYFYGILGYILLIFNILGGIAIGIFMGVVDDLYIKIIAVVSSFSGLLLTTMFPFKISNNYRKAWIKIENEMLIEESKEFPDIEKLTKALECGEKYIGSFVLGEKDYFDNNELKVLKGRINKSGTT